MRIAYEGGSFRGFQRQPGLPTVEEALLAALRPLGLSPRLEVAARTDAGVHADAQVVSFSARADLDPVALREAVNRGTPAALTCLAAWCAHPSFHARASATSRTYRYLVGAPAPQALEGRAWSLPDERAFPGLGPVEPDGGRMAEALAAAVGEHDFAGFARPGEQRGSVRTVTAIDVERAAWAPLWSITISGRGFLRAQVRNLVGTAVTVGVGLAPPSRIAEILRDRGRYRGVRAPAWGLTLTEVAYPAALAGPLAGAGVVAG
jgi:tRNA pseudouridine38-40 synthase